MTEVRRSAAGKATRREFSRRTRWSLVALLSSFIPACGGYRERDTPRAESAALAGDVIARVGDRTLSAEWVRRVSSAQRLSVEAATAALISDTLSALGFESQKPEAARYLRRTLLARQLLEEIQVAAVSQGPVTDSELEVFTQRRWRDLDRPASARVTHVVVMIGKTCDRVKARHAIERVAAALKPDLSAEAFRAAAKSIEVAPCERKVEDLDPVTPDGRTVGASDGTYVRTFAEAANALAKVGQQSGIIETEFGFHVLFLTEQLPEKRFGKEERRAQLLGEVRRERGKVLMREVLKAARGDSPPELKSDANALMGLVQEVP